MFRGGPVWFLAATLVLCCALVNVSASGRFVLEEIDGRQSSGRFLLQAGKSPNCTRINPFCSQCRNQRIPGTRRSELVCSVCQPGYKLRRDGTSRICDCAPGRALSPDATCQPLPLIAWPLLALTWTEALASSAPDQEAAVNECTACPHNWRTKDLGSTGVAMCLAPPGWELVDGAENITECQIGWYKADWNRNLCLSLGLQGDAWMGYYQHSAQSLSGWDIQ
ncbi:hypothetical protein OEZ85_012370 [Tetradesmus obliquus]|uniref:Tyrosine-protein kinase ephrin type A/B receptor-like domain-containing protein n=1 Tax=Tetradesmus obliquus TaxID=3088 RepID=A0ABY8TT48_TETOB|nr:hypothetical protein OEZ85_012370 [Tetradesmus obliquus]